jgi:thiazole synthase
MMNTVVRQDALKIGGVELHSRLLVGTGKFASYDLIPEVVKAAGAQVVTVALRRVDWETPGENMLEYLPKEVIVMPNTSGARNAAEAVRSARIARDAGCGNWVKIEVIADQRYLLPDNFETLKATEILAKEGFIVLPYMSPDLAPIGSNRGLKTKELVRIMIEELQAPVIVDAGIGKPSEAAEAMEMGASAVLVNTALATAANPILMAEAFGKAVAAGRLAFLGGPGATRIEASASSPLTGFLTAEA